VNGDLGIMGNAKIQGLRGNVHANGNITGNTSKGDNISGDVTATGTVDDISMRRAWWPAGCRRSPFRRSGGGLQESR
jgi:hypothetical protein